MSNQEIAGDTGRLMATGVRRLKPGNTKIFEGAFSMVHCVIAPNEQYRGVFAVRMFPISHPDRYISLCYTNEEDKICEIGVIENLNEFSDDVQGLVRKSMKKQYHEQVIARIHEVRCEYGMLFFDVTTKQGRREFVMPWRHDRAEDYGMNGKVLLDALDNRYLIPDVEALPIKDRNRFTGFIYW